MPITAIVYILSLTPLFSLNATELITFSVGAVLLVLAEPARRRLRFSALPSMRKKRF